MNKQKKLEAKILKVCQFYHLLHTGDVEKDMDTILSYFIEDEEYEENSPASGQ